jgi:type IV secretion system protein VirD4
MNNKKRKGGMQDQTLLGSSKWSTSEGDESSIALNGYNLVIGYPMRNDGAGLYRLQDRWFAQAPNRHCLSVAPTRSGKGVSLIIPNLLLYAGSAMVIDPKGENAWITAEYRRKGLNQKTMILDPWGEVNRRYGEKAGELETAARFNPLSILDPESEHYADDIAYLADALIINQGKDPHWDDSARELVAGLIAYVVEHPDYREEASLPLVRVFLTKPAADICALAKDAQKFGHESVAARKLGRFVVDSKEIASIISTALTQTAFLDSKTLAQNLEKSDFSFNDLIDGTATIYLVLPVDKLQTYGRWLRLMVSIGIRTVARNVRKLPLPVLFMLDEFGTIGKLSAVAQAYGLMAGLQMVLWAFVQDLVQLKRDYPEDWETFIGNSEAVTFMGVMDQFTAEYVSRMLGTTTVERISQGTAEARAGKPGIIFSTPANPNYSAMADQVFSRPLLDPAEVRKVTRDIGVMITRYQPCDFDRIVYHKDPLFIDRARPDPHYPGIEEDKEKRQIESLVARALPDITAVYAALDKQGYKIKEKGLFAMGDKITVIAPDGKEHYFRNDEALFNAARVQMVKWVTLTTLGKAFAERAKTEETITLPVALWFVPSD